MLWAQVLDWVPPIMHNVEEARKLLEGMLPEAFFEHVHYTLGSFSQVIQGGFPKVDLMDYTYRICPQMSALILVAFNMIKCFKGNPDFVVFLNN